MLNIAIVTDVHGEEGWSAPLVSKSCEATVGDGRCPLARDLGASSVVAWYAIVRADDAGGSRLRIEFRDRSATGALVETRDLAFSEHDSTDSRWASAGAIIAAFVAARDSPDTARTVRRAVETGPARVPIDSRISWGFDLAVVTGPGLDRGALRVGALGRGFVGLPNAPNFFFVLSLRYAERPGDLDVSWASASGGLGVSTGKRDAFATAELLGELAVERLFVTGRNEVTGHEASSAENRFGGRLGVNGTLGLWRGFSFVLGGDVAVMLPSVDITFLDARVGRAPNVEFGLSGGLRFRQ